MSYFEDGKIRIGNSVEMTVTCYIPQGVSTWTFAVEHILRRCLLMLERVLLLGYADDLAIIVVKGKTGWMLENKYRLLHILIGG